MSLFQAGIYGLIQGLTEFLPISSSAHLTLLPFFTKWEDPGLAFDVALHWGTLAAVFIYFRRDIVNLILHDRPLCWKIAAATVPGAVIGLLFEKHAETLFRSPMLIAATLSLMGVALWIADQRGAKTADVAHLSFAKIMLIGLGQGLAIVPGVSRSGITITMGLLLGLKREEAVRFSFYLAMPITLGAGLVKSKYLLANLGNPSILVAIGTSALFGFLAIHVLLTYVRNRSFLPFTIYRLALAAVVIFLC